MGGKRAKQSAEDRQLMVQERANRRNELARLSYFILARLNRSCTYELRRIIPVASRIGKPGIYYASVAPGLRENSGNRYQTLSDSHQLSANSIGK